MWGNGEMIQQISENPEPEDSVPSKLFTARVKERLKIKSIYPNIYMGFCFESTATIFW